MQAEADYARELVRNGVAAARAGDRERARALLVQATRLEPGEAAAWLWLASVAESTQEKVAHLRRFVELEPDHEQGTETLKKSLLELGASLARQGDRMRARAVLSELSELDERNALVWVRLAAVAPTPGEAREALERALHLDPHNDKAIALLEQLQGQAGSAASLPGSAGPPPAAPSLSALRPPAAPPARPAARVEAPGAMPQPPAKPGAAAPPVLRTVLVIDGDEQVRGLVTQSLQPRGYRVVAASDGVHGLTRMDEVRPELILVEAAMSRMDGYQMCRMIRASETAQGIPVVLLTEKDGFFDRMRGRMAGANDSIAKPLEPEALARLVEKHCPVQAREGG
jgi:twitching motility two-component system response regulator PilG